MQSIFFVFGSALVLADAGISSECWTLSTADTEIRVSASDHGPTISRLAGTQEKHNWTATPISVPLMDKVWIEDRQIPLAWSFQQGSMDEESGRLTLTFANRDPKLLLRSIWRARDGHGPVEHWMEIENTSTRRVTVSHQDSLCLPTIHPGGSAALWWVKRGGVSATTQGGTFTTPLTAELDLVLPTSCNDGASPVPWLAVQVGRKRGLYVGWEFSGVGRIHAQAKNGDATLAVDVGNRPEFKTDVESGETFLVPPAFVGCYTGDVDDGSYCLHQFFLEKLRPPMPEGCPDPILVYNFYMDYDGPPCKPKEADVLLAARKAVELGFDVFMQDAGWFPQVGDWRWDPLRFPNGFRPIEQFVHDSGLRMGLWCAWTNGGLSEHLDALNCHRHADWFNTDFAPDWQPSLFTGGRLCLASAAAQRWTTKTTQQIVAKQKLDYFKHDIGPIIDVCGKKTHRHRYGVDVSYWATIRYYEVQEALRAAFPNLILENCSAGGHIKDYGAMRRAHYIVGNDHLSNLPDRQSIYDSSFAMPPLVIQCYTMDNIYVAKGKGDDPGPFLWRSAMMGAWQIIPVYARNWTPEMLASVKRATDIYKRWIRPILHDAKVHHILPRPDGEIWDGMFYWSPSLDKGTLYIFRPDSAERTQTVRLKGLEAGARYRLWCEDGSIETSIVDGRELTKEGLAITLPNRYSSDLIFIQDASLDEPEGFWSPGEFRLRPARVDAGHFSVSAELRWDPSDHARSYRVLVAGDGGFQDVLHESVVIRPSFSVPDLPRETQLFWKVEAISYGGKRINDGGPESFVTPAVKRLVGIRFASDMKCLEATVGAGNPLRRDRNYYGAAITIDGREYPKGLWTHSFNDGRPADVVFDISETNFAHFKADAGLDDSGGGSVQFQVLVDGTLRAETPVMRPRQVHRLWVEVSGAERITLRVLNGGDGYSADHAVWGLARFVETGADDPLDRSE